MEDNKKRKATAEAEEEEEANKGDEAPQKRFFRQRAHCNPLSHNTSFNYPVSPDRMEWKNDELYDDNTPPTVVDIGCGFGGLTMALAKELPEERILGMEIRAKVTEYVRLRIVHSRKEQNLHHNAAVLRTNSMKFLPNFFVKSSIHKIFICFPDPHFKRKNHQRRIISTALLDEYAYVLKPGAKLYCITDVKELHEWHVQHCDAHAMFQKQVCSTENNMEDPSDPCIEIMKTVTEEGQKVERNGGSKYYAVYSRENDDQCRVVDSTNFF